MLHSSAVVLDGKGFVFVGHSEAGKSTMIKMLTGKAKILCDDRNIIRNTAQGFRVYGTWHHGEITTVSPDSAPLQGIFLLEKALHTCLRPVEDKAELLSRLSACTIRTIKPLGTVQWWNNTLTVLEEIVKKVPCYFLEFNKSGDVVDVLREFNS
jgi:ABC-type cobalamin/Fe3+-siderophores transport system ATPase subunit